MIVSIRDIIDDVLNDPKNIIPLGRPVHVVVPSLYNNETMMHIPKGIKIDISIYYKDEVKCTYSYQRWRVRNIRPRYYTTLKPRDVIIDSDFSEGDNLDDYIRIYHHGKFLNKETKFAIYFQEMNKGE